MSVSLRWATGLTLGALATLPACGGAHHENGQMHAEFKTPEEWALRFDDPARDAWQKPDVVIRHLRLSSDSRVPQSSQRYSTFSACTNRAGV